MKNADKGKCMNLLILSNIVSLINRIKLKEISNKTNYKNLLILYIINNIITINYDIFI